MFILKFVRACEPSVGESKILGERMGERRKPLGLNGFARSEENTDNFVKNSHEKALDRTEWTGR